MQGQLLQLAGQPGAVAADRFGQGLGGGRLQPQAQFGGGALHQIHLTLAIPDGR